MPIEPGTPLPWRSYECPCGDPLCNQHTISGQRSVGFEPDDAAYIVAACNAYPELLAAVREAREALADGERQIRWQAKTTGCSDRLYTWMDSTRATLTRLDAILAEQGNDRG